MNTTIPFKANICFTGAPASGLEMAATQVHTAAEAATSCGIPFFDQQLWIDPDSVLLEGEGAEKVFAIADTFLGRFGPRGEEHGFYVLRGPLDVVALAKMKGLPLPPAFAVTCARLIERIDLLVFQLPDVDGWRWQGFPQQLVEWLQSYSKTVFQTARQYGLRMEQFRVLPPPRGDANMRLTESTSRVFGVAINPLRPASTTTPLASVLRRYDAESRDVFEASAGSIFGIPHFL